MALRKVNGASRRILISQIMGEAVLISIISVNVGLALLELVKPLFNSIMGLDIRIGYLDNPWIIPAFLLTGIIIGIISGIYPAISITGFITGRSMSLDIKDTSAGVGVRRVLSVFQVFVSIILITSTFVVYSQLRFIDKSDLGFDKDLLVFLHLNREIYPRADAFREELTEASGH